MKKHLFTVVLVSALGSLGIAEDLRGRVGITGTALGGFTLGQKSVRDAAKDVAPLLGGMVSYGLTSHWGIGASYENFDLGNGNGLRVEPVILQGIYRLWPQKVWTPTLLAGGGISRGVDAKNFHHPAAKAGLGIEYFAAPWFSLGPQVNYYYVANTQDSPRHLSALGAGLALSYYFGGCKSCEKPAKPAPVAQTPPPTPVPAVVPVAVTITPAAASLQQGQSQAFSASVAGTANNGVTWSHAPALGTLSPAGVYTAPATVSLAEKVTVTAASTADPSKTASAVVQLNPPAAAPQAVNIRLDVLFDTGKDVVKAEYWPEIQRVADFMKTYASARAEIAGHTDNVGSPEGNRQLSERRANAVRNELVQRFGIAPERLTAKGYGQTSPMADNATAEGRAKNRRVVAVISAGQ